MIGELYDAIKERLERDLKDLTLRHQGDKPNGDFAGPPHVWIGDTPPKNGGWASIFPAVVLVPVGEFQDEQGGISTVSIDFECTVYNVEGDGQGNPKKQKGDTVGGEYDMGNLMHGITRSLIKCSFTHDERLLDRYWLIPDPAGKLLYWQKYATQARPLLQAVMHSLWQFGYME